MQYRLAILARRVAGALAEAAFFVRLAAAELTSTLLELAVVTWVAAPPSPRAALFHVGHAARSLKALPRAALPGTNGGPPREDAHAPRRGIRRRLPTPREVTLLSDRRVRRLQRRVISVVFLRRFGLTVGDDALDILSAYSSVSWIARNLSAAAGYGARPPRTVEAEHRLRVVLPVLAYILALHGRYMAPRPAGRSEAGGTAHCSATGGLITAELYPRSIPAETLRHRLEAAERRERHRAQALRTAALELRLERHLNAITLLPQLDETRGHGCGRGLGPATARRLFSALERLRFRTTGGTHVRMDQ
jgi:hypothetical protein